MAASSSRHIEPLLPHAGGSTTPQTMTATAVAVSASMQRQTNKPLTATAVAATASLVKQVNKSLTATAIAVTATMKRQVNKSLTATSVAVTASLVALKVIVKTMTASVAVSASMTRQTQKTLRATSVLVTASMMRQVNKTLRATSVAVTASLTALKVIVKAMTASVVVSASMTKQIGKRLTATSVVSGILSALKQTFGRVVAVDVIVGDEPAAPIVAYVQDRVEVRPGDTPAAQVIASDIPWFLVEAVEEDMVLHKFDFQFDTPGLNNGVVFYTPAVGEVLIGLGIYFKTAWNDTARGDVGQGFTPSFSDFLGFHTGGLYDLTNVDRGGFFTTATELNDNVAVVNPGLGEFGCIYVFNNTDPLKVWVSTTGGRTDPTPAATAGAATLYWVTLTL
jgi:hypothetical protein